jgi:hypothetical protein
MSTDTVAQSTEQRISDHGAKIAAGRLGIAVDEYRRHEAAGEHWCPRCESWVPWEQFRVRKGRDGYCAPCMQSYQSGLDIDARVFLTPEGAERAYPAPASSGHQYCPAVLGCREGRIPEGWVPCQS